MGTGTREVSGRGPCHPGKPAQKAAPPWGSIHSTCWVQSIKAPQPARSLYMLQGPLICKRCCLPSDPWGAASAFEPLLKGCFQCSLCAIYVSLCRTAFLVTELLTKCPQSLWRGFPFPLKHASLKKKHSEDLFMLSQIIPLKT